MSEKLTKGKFIHGSIYKITLENFMTYSYVEFFPGQSLNLIIGPNGSGKSSIIYAIILGLGGEPCDISKNKRISFIKKGTREAKIEIELYHKKKPNTIITTTLTEHPLTNRPNKLSYKKDHETITREQLVTCVSKDMGIQVSNLCQVLPQLRVQAFSKMNYQELLVNTISAISELNYDGVKIRKDLIDKSKDLKDLENENQISEKNVKKLQKLNTIDESKVRDVEDQTRLRKKIELYKMKENWLSYIKNENTVIKYKEEMECNSKLIEDLEKKKAEKVKEKENIAQKKSCDQKSLKSIETQIDHLKEKINNRMESITSEARKFQIIEDSLVEKGTENLKRDNELNDLRDRLKKLQQDLSNSENEHGNEISLQNQYKEKDELIKKLHQQRDELDREILCMENDQKSITNSINAAKKELEKLNDKYDTKVLLEQNYRDTYLALKWLDENRSLFQHRVYNPMLLEIDFDVEEDAKFLENTVSKRDLTAFCFENAQEMEIFLKKVRSELGYKQVNACKVSSETNLRLRPIDDITQYGFSRYVGDTFLAPDLVRKYLCARYSVHNAPLGNVHTDVPTHVPLYFTDKHKVSVKKSAYSGLYSKYTTFITPAKLLKSYKPKIKIIEERLNNLVNDKNEKTEKLESLKIDRDKLKLNQKIKIEKESNDEIRKKIDKLKEIRKSIEENQRLYEKESEIGKVDIEVEKVEARRQQAHITQALVKEQSDLLQDVRRLHAIEIYRSKLKKRFDGFEQKYVRCEKEVKELDINLNDQKKKKHAVQEKIKACEMDMTLIKHTFLDPENKLPSDPDFLYKEQFDELPKLAKDLSIESRRISRDPKLKEDYSQYLPIVEEYKKRAKEIKQKNGQIEVNKRKIQELKDIISEREPKWLNDLAELVESINESFKDTFEKLGFKGEVLLDTDQEDISKYGIKIMVSFSSAPMQPLDAARQSGGERAVSTAGYLLALQSVASAPFRCLDEINQGMDAKNERSLMKILMDVSSEEDHCQYFVLSPKLLKNLEYNDTVKVHVIMSGEFNVPSDVWEMDTFLEKAKDYGKNNSDVDE